MTNDDIVTRLRAVLHNDRSVELMNREAAEEIERLRAELDGSLSAFAAMRKERDQARRAWCLYLAANTGLQQERIADLHGWDCYNQTPNDIEEHEVRGDVPGINL